MESLRDWLDRKVDQYNHPSFIANDPISVPHRFSSLQDIEIAGFFAAIMAWGQRPTIIRKANELMALMDDAPFEFISQHKEKDRKRFLSFRHRTLQPDDIIYLVNALQTIYHRHHSLEEVFSSAMNRSDDDVFDALCAFHNTLFDHRHPLERTRKHIATPARKSSCKRINMYLRWMVRKDGQGVDFGLWDQISPAQLIVPLDLHVGKVARHLGLLSRSVNDWQAATELTARLKEMDADDPVKYDFALFGMGIDQSISSMGFLP
jgi:uncharacterized protein (TIGR02757 family)